MYVHRTVQSFDRLSTLSSGTEFDAVALIVHTGEEGYMESTKKIVGGGMNANAIPIQTIVLLDSSCNVLAVHLKGRGAVSVVSSLMSRYINVWCGV